MERNLRQMRRLGAMSASSGMGVIYKIPKGHEKVAAQIERLGKTLGISPQVILV